MLFNGIAGVSNLLVISVLTHNIDKDIFAKYLIFLTLATLVPILVYPGFAKIINKGAIANNSRFVKQAISMSLRMSLIMTPLYLIGCVVFGFITEKLDLAILAAMASIFIPLNAWDRSDGILKGNTDFKALRWLRLIHAILALALVGLAVYLTHNVFVVSAAYTLARIATAILGMNRANRFLREGDASSQEDVDTLIKQGVQFGFLAGFNVVAEHIDKFVLYGLGAEALSYFYTGGHVPLKLRDYLTNATVVPIMSWLKQGDEVYRNKLRHFGFLMLVGLLSLSALLAYTASWYIPLLFGEGYTEAVPIARILSFTLLVQVLAHFLVMRAIIHEDSIFYQRVTYFKQTVYLVLLVPVIHLYGAVGAAALLLGVAVLNLILHALHCFPRGKAT